MPTLCRAKNRVLLFVMDPKSKPKDIVCFIIITDSECAECKTKLFKGGFLFMDREKEQPLCLTCADLDHLVYLPAGDAALSRRARKHSPITVVAVKFSRARKRYERQGILVSEEALEKAEAECLADEDVRARKRERAEERRVALDVVFAQKMKERILELFPNCPAEDAQSIANHTTVRGSGRVGRSAEGQSFEKDAVTLAVRAHIRHCYTDYDRRLMKHGDRALAREEVIVNVDDMAGKWSQSRKR